KRWQLVAQFDDLPCRLTVGRRLVPTPTLIVEIPCRQPCQPPQFLKKQRPADLVMQPLRHHRRRVRNRVGERCTAQADRNPTGRATELELAIERGVEEPSEDRPGEPGRYRVREHSSRHDTVTDRKQDRPDSLAVRHHRTMDPLNLIGYMDAIDRLGDLHSNGAGSASGERTPCARGVECEPLEREETTARKLPRTRLLLQCGEECGEITSNLGPQVVPCVGNL